MDITKKQILSHSKMPQQLKDAFEARQDAYGKFGISPVVKRRILKTATWRVVSTGITATGVLIVTGSLAFAGVVGLIDAAIKTTAYYFHEHFWDKSDWYS